MVALAHVGDHGHLAAVKAQPLAQHAAPGAFEHRRVHLGVGQHVARAFGAGAVAAVDLAARHVHTIGIGHAYAQALGGKNMGNQPGGGGFAVGARHRHDRDAAIVVRREQQINHGLAHIAGFAKRGGQVHAQAGGGVHFNDAAALGLQGLEHGFGNHIHATNVQPNAGRRLNGAGGNGGMHVIGHVGGTAAGGQVGVVAQHHALALGGNAVRGEPFAGQAPQGDIVQADFGQRRAMATAPARVLVYLFDQLGHAVYAIAQHLRRIAPGGGDQLVAHHQQTKIVARQKALHHHLAAVGQGRGVGRFQLGAGGDVHRHAFALVAVLGFDDHGPAIGQAHFLRHGPGILHIHHRAAQRHGHPGGVQQALG